VFVCFVSNNEVFVVFCEQQLKADVVAAVTPPSNIRKVDSEGQGRRSPISSPIDFMSSIIMDTTSQHLKHIFDLNCRICTGRVPVPDSDSPASKQAVKAAVDAAASKESAKRAELGVSSIDRLPVVDSSNDDVSDKLYWGNLPLSASSLGYA
jgi:hypothetical protein